MPLQKKRFTLEEFALRGFTPIATFGNSYVTLAKRNKRVLVCKEDRNAYVITATYRDHSRRYVYSGTHVSPARVISRNEEYNGRLTV